MEKSRICRLMNIIKIYTNTFQRQKKNLVLGAATTQNSNIRIKYKNAVP